MVKGCSCGHNHKDLHDNIKKGLDSKLPTNRDTINVLDPKEKTISKKFWSDKNAKN
jgi:hypothetical protein